MKSDDYADLEKTRAHYDRGATEYVKKLMEITLRKGLEPVNAAEDRPNQCLRVASFEKAPKLVLQALAL